MKPGKKLKTRMVKKAFEINDIYTAVKSANYGIEIVVSFESEKDQMFNHNFITLIKNILERNNLLLECKLGISTKGDLEKNKGVMSILAGLNKSGWEVRKFDSNTINFISVDKGRDFFIWEIKDDSVNVFDPGFDGYGRRHLFDHMWELAEVPTITKKYLLVLVWSEHCMAVLNRSALQPV